MNQEHRLKEASIRELLSPSSQDLASESAAYTVSEVELSETSWRTPSQCLFVPRALNALPGGP